MYQISLNQENCVFKRLSVYIFGYRIAATFSEDIDTRLTQCLLYKSTVSSGNKTGILVSCSSAQIFLLLTLSPLMSVWAAIFSEVPSLLRPLC